MVWHFRPQARAYRFVGHKVNITPFIVYGIVLSHNDIGCCSVCCIFTFWSSFSFSITRQNSAPLDSQCVSEHVNNNISDYNYMHIVKENQQCSLLILRVFDV